MKRKIALLMMLFGVMFGGVAEASSSHTAANGESLYKIGEKYGIPWEVIKRTNQLQSDRINAGQTLLIPSKHVVQRGDTLWNLSRTFGVPLAKLQFVNNEYDDLLNIGDTVYIPTGVQTQSMNEADLDLFARLVNAEAKGEPYEGKVAVASVVLNRVKSPEFPNTIRGVILQYYGSIPAFSPVDNGEIHKPADDEARRAVQEALNGKDPTFDALYFYNPDLVSPTNWIRQRTVTVKIGDHVFAK
ncbi:cell wall hydrolase [Effusibacillus consociatus]|uniref:Cell wall hydrolase n=1 Tax=Effusibacillus consociatus TaxID=1117041 RepID=A0ABV9PXT8_9BACL